MATSPECQQPSEAGRDEGQNRPCREHGPAGVQTAGLRNVERVTPAVLRHLVCDHLLQQLSR